MPEFHHVELWVADLDAAAAEWGWLLGRVGFRLEQEWSSGQPWRAGGAYLTFTTSPNLSNATHDRRSAGLNHLAFRAGPASLVDAIMAEAPEHGWAPLYQWRSPSSCR